MKATYAQCFEYKQNNCYFLNYSFALVILYLNVKGEWKKKKEKKTNSFKISKIQFSR